MIVDIRDVKIIENNYIVYDNKVIKPEILPDWDCSIINDIRKSRGDNQVYDIASEIIASKIAKLIGVNTPAIEKTQVVIKDGSKKHTTASSLREHLNDLRYKQFTDFFELCSEIRYVCCRDDFMYVKLYNLLLGSSEPNIYYNFADNKIIAADFDFTPNAAPMNIDGVSSVFEPYFFTIKSGIFNINMKWLESIVDKFIYNTVKHKDLIKKINPEIYYRLLMLKKSIYEFISKYKLGSSK